MAPAQGVQITAIVADELPVVRTGLVSILEHLGIDVIAEAASGREAAQLCSFRSPGLLVAGALVDMRLTSLFDRVRHLDSRPVVLGLMRGPSDDVAELARHGIDGLALRSASVAELTRTIERVAAGDKPIAAALLSAVAPRPGSTATPDAAADDLGLSAREREVLELIAAGHSNREIAGQLFMSAATAKSHVAHILDKLGVHSRTEVAGVALAKGLIG